MNSRKAQFWNLWLLIAFIIVLMLFVWYSFSVSSKIDTRNAGEQSAQVFSMYQEKERLTLFIDHAADEALRFAVNELASKLPGICGKSETDKPIINSNQNCIQAENVMNVYIAIASERLNELVADYPNSPIPKLNMLYDSSIKNPLVIYSENPMIIQPPMEIIMRSSESSGYSTMVTRITTTRKIPASYYELEEVAVALNNLQSQSFANQELQQIIKTSLDSKNPYCESDPFANTKFLNDINSIITKCPFVDDNPCLCGSLTAPNELIRSDRGLVFVNNENSIRVVYSIGNVDQNRVIANFNGVNKELYGFLGVPVQGQSLSNYIKLGNGQVYIYSFPRNEDLQISKQSEVPLNLLSGESGAMIFSDSQILADESSIPFCSNIVESSNYKVNIFVWDGDQNALSNIKNSQGERSSNYDLYAIPSSDRNTYVHDRLIDPARMESNWNGNAINIFILPKEIKDLSYGLSTHAQFNSLPTYLNGFIKMNEDLYHPSETFDEVCYEYCEFLGGNQDECRQDCTDCPAIRGTTQVLSASSQIITGAENPGTLDEVYGNSFQSLVNKDVKYPYLAIYYPSQVNLDCNMELLSTSTDLDGRNFVNGIVESVVMGMNSYYSAPLPSIDVCIDYPIKELLYNSGTEETYQIEEIYPSVAVPKETDNVWPIEFGRITQCFGETPTESELRYSRHIGIDMQPPAPRLGYGQGLADYFPEGIVVASFDGIIVEYGVCNYAGSADPCSEIRVGIQDITSGGYTNILYPNLNANTRNGYGEYMILKHPEHNLYAVYAHLYPGSIDENSFIPLENPDGTVSSIDRITKGTPIGLVGNSGYSTGAHLHYELYSLTPSGKERHNPMCFLPKTIEQNGKPSDISKFFPISGVPIETEYRQSDGEEEREGEEDPEEIDYSTLVLPDSGWALNCYVNYYDAYFGTGMKDVCPTFT